MPKKRESVGIEITGSIGTVIGHAQVSGFDVGVRLEGSDKTRVGTLRHDGHGTALQLIRSNNNIFETVIGTKISEAQADELLGAARTGGKEGFVATLKRIVSNVTLEKVEAGWSVMDRFLRASGWT